MVCSVPLVANSELPNTCFSPTSVPGVSCSQCMLEGSASAPCLVPWAPVPSLQRPWVRYQMSSGLITQIRGLTCDVHKLICQRWSNFMLPSSQKPTPKVHTESSVYSHHESTTRRHEVL